MNMTKHIVSADRKPKKSVLDLLMGLRWRVRCKLGMLRFRYIMGVQIGKGTTVNPAATFMDYGMVSIGDNCSISGALFITHSGGDRIFNLRQKPSDRRSIYVGDNTMIGAATTIMPGVRIGDRCIIGAGCYISRDVPDNTVMKPPEAVAVCRTDVYVRARMARA